jgi:predicted nucleic acid-binding protein
MNRVFLDTGYLIALEASDDQHHEEAIRHWRQSVPEISSIVTTTYVFDEVVTFFNSRNHHEKAVEIGDRLLRSPRVEVVQVSEGLFGAGWRRFQDRPDKRYSLTDSISFTVMERRGLDEALAFDRHFEQAGYRILPARGGT